MSHGAAPCSHLLKAAEGMGIETVMERVEGRVKGTRRVTCTACSAIENISHSSNAPPEQVKQSFERKGWKVKRRNWTCPSCQQRKKQPIPTTKGEELVTTNTASLRTPTPEERARIRHMLDGHFDDTKGMFLDGYSDKRIGEELNLPWKMVEMVREAAYGPIRIPPEHAALLAEIDALRSQVAEVRKQAQAAVDHLTVQLSQLQAKAEKQFPAAK